MNRSPYLKFILSFKQELDYIFGHSLIEHAEYQAKIYLPYWVQRYLLLRKDIEVEPLYNFNGLEAEIHEGVRKT